MLLSDEDRKALTCDPSDYTYKYTISSTGSSWLMVYHFEDISTDVEVCVYHLDHERASKIFEHIRHLLSLRSEYIHSPQKVFNWCGELWLIFPFCTGRTLNEVLNRNHTDGLPNERLTARILLDVLEALEILHKANLCHRSVATYNLFLEKATGVTKLKDFTNLKFVEEEELNHKTIWKANDYSWLKPPEMLGFYASSETKKDVDERKADIFLFAITALNLAYGSAPRSPYQNKSVLKPTSWIAPSEKHYLTKPKHISDAFFAMLAPCLSQSTRARPTATDLKKNKFFKRAASRSDVKKLLCSFFKIVEPPQINDLPPSQSPNFSSPATGSCAWDFGSVDRVLSEKRPFGNIIEGVKKEVIQQRNEKSSTPLENMEDHNLDLDSRVSGAGDEPLVPLSVKAKISRENSTEQILDTDGANTCQKSKTRFHVLKYDELNGECKKPQAVSEQSIPITGDQQTPHDPDARIIKRFHVKEDANKSTLPPGDVSASCTSASNPLVQPLANQSLSATKKLASRFKVEDVQHVGSVGSQTSPSRWHQKSPTEWVIEDVCDWLQSLGGDFKVYVNNFREAGIDGDMLHALTGDELDELQVTKKIHKRRILTSINKLQWS